MTARTLRIGVAGLGGYAAAISDHLLRIGESAGLRLVGVGDPQRPDHAVRAELLRDRGVNVVDSLDRLLDLPIDAVWLPVPIGLHRPFTERALAAGKVVMVEKPAAGTVQNVDAMIAARDAAGRAVAVGFQTLFLPETWQAKRRLLAGAIGRVRRASVLGCWPLGDAYYGRNAWAGRLRHGDAWVLDSPANNAMAHYLHLALFLLGPSPRASCLPATVQAELYRANPIENYDICTLRLTLPNDATLLVAMTHACESSTEPIVRIEGESGVLEFEYGVGYRWGCRNGRSAAGDDGRPVGTTDAYATVIGRLADLVRGDSEIEHASLENARAHTLVMNAVSESAEVNDVPPDCIQTIGLADARVRVVPSLHHALAECAERGRLLGESGRMSWAAGKSNPFDLSGYKKFGRPANAAVASKGSERD